MKITILKPSLMKKTILLIIFCVITYLGFTQPSGGRWGGRWTGTWEWSGTDKNGCTYNDG
jgi:hypothetical protein